MPAYGQSRLATHHSRLAMIIHPSRLAICPSRLATHPSRLAMTIHPSRLAIHPSRLAMTIHPSRLAMTIHPSFCSSVTKFVNTIFLNEQTNFATNWYTWFTGQTKGWKCRLSGSVGRRSRTQEAEIRFGGLWGHHIDPIRSSSLLVEAYSSQNFGHQNIFQIIWPTK